MKTVARKRLESNYSTFQAGLPDGRTKMWPTFVIYKKNCPKKAIDQWGKVRLRLPTDEIGAMGREIESRQGLGWLYLEEKTYKDVKPPFDPS
jgi:hypothetical protein